MSQQPLVSIIMAVKDTAPYLHDCIDSIIDQTYQNWELLAVNDHSTDETPQILEEYAEKHNYLIYSRCKDEFSRYEAVHMAIDNGFDGVILENLS